MHLIRTLIHNNLDALLLCAGAVFYIFLAPFTKVEESFNVQATYDLLYKPRANISAFDHVSFPGVVPRTFLSPLALHAYVAPVRRAFSLSPLQTLTAVRLSLALLSVCGLLHIRNALRSRHSAQIGTFFTLLTATQFHQLFYAGRPLPNTFALVLANIALALRIRGTRSNLHLSYALLALAVAVFRSELCILLFWTIILDAASRRTRFLPSALTALLAASAGAVLSILIDTNYWGVTPGSRFPFRYPELEVFYFNAVLGKSSAWGTSPMHWYFTHALPRALGGAFPLLLPGLLNAHPPIADILLPTALFVATYSLLPHKELRFVFYALPAANVAAAHALAALLRVARAPRKGKAPDWRSSARRATAAIVLLAAPAASVLLTAVSAAASANNYPGAHALLALPRLRGCDVPARVHVDAHAASTGVSQFVEAAARCPDWTISREEKVPDDRLRDQFTHLVGNREHVPGFRLLHAQHAFAGVDLRNLRLRSRPDVFVLERVLAGGTTTEDPML